MTRRLVLHVASLTTETNTFSPLPTGWAAFEAGERVPRDASRLAPDSSLGSVHRLWRTLAAAEGHGFSEGMAAAAQPAGPTLRAVHEGLRDELINTCEATGPHDVLLLHLHGAMVAEGCDDCEGDLLRRLRQRLGRGVCIAVLLDLHCHLSEAMVAEADLLVAYQHYPHTDIAARAEQLYHLACAKVRGEIRPVTAVFDCRMVGLWPTVQPPMRGFVARLQAQEAQAGVLSVSFGHGFPWGDVADAGAKLWVVTDGDARRADVLARRLGRGAYRLRHAGAPAVQGIDEALDAALAALQAPGQGPVVLADVADNPGGGAAGDSTFILQRLLARGVTGAASGCYWDPVAVQHCMEAGVGARLPLRIGGKTGPASGLPVDLLVTVKAIATRHGQTGLGGHVDALGAAAWVQGEGLDLVLVSLRSQVYARDAFSGLGLDPAACRLVVVKSTQHFLADFGPMARQVHFVATPGAIAPDFAHIAYRKARTDVWPRVADPLGLDAGRPARAG